MSLFLCHYSSTVFLQLHPSKSRLCTIASKLSRSPAYISQILNARNLKIGLERKWSGDTKTKSKPRAGHSSLGNTKLHQQMREEQARGESKSKLRDVVAGGSGDRGDPGSSRDSRDSADSHEPPPDHPDELPAAAIPSPEMLAQLAKEQEEDGHA